MKKCKQGYYYCYTEKKCKKIPMGYHLGARGYLAKDNDNDNEGEDTTKNGNGNGNGNGGNGNGGGVSESIISEKRDGKSAKDKGYSLRDWFKGGGWKQTGGKYDGKPCAKQPGQTTKPYCRDADDRAAMSKDERNKAAAKKRREDPNPNRKGKAKMVTQNNSFEPEANVVEEEKKKKKDACYHKVKSRYSVWPSAYASGALVKCRKVGAANWGNKSEEVETTGLGEGKIADRLRQMNKAAKERWDTEGEKAKKDAYKALDKVKSNQARMEKGLTEGTQFSNWRDDFKAMEYEFIDIIKPEPLVSEGIMPDPIDPEKHKDAQKKQKMRNLAIGNDNPNEKKVAEKKAGGPKMMGEEQIDEAGKKCWKGYKKKGTQTLFGKTYNRCVKANEEVVDEMISTSGVRRYDTPEAQKSIRQKKEKEQKRKRRPAPERTPEGDRVIRGRDARGSYKMVKRVKFYEDKEEVIDEKIDVRKQSSKRKSLGRGSSINPDAKKTGYESPSEFRKTEKKLAPYMGEDFEKEVPSGDISKLVKKAVKRIDQNVSGHVDKKDKSMGEYGEFVPSPDGKSKIVTSVKRESFSDWRSDLGEDWQKSNRKDGVDGMSQSSVDAYRRENPGSKLQTAVTGNPKKGSKDAKRRSSYCSRSEGQKDMHNIDCSKTPDKAICKARRRWKC